VGGNAPEEEIAMSIETFPDLPISAVALDLEPSTITTRSKPVRLEDRVEFGGPIVTSITEDYHKDDTDLQAFLVARASSYRFVLAHMSVNFPPKEPSLSQASVQVNLSDDANSGLTLAYSIFPTHLRSPYEVTRGYELGPELTIGPVAAKVGTFSSTTVEHGTRDFIFGGPELSAHPAWIFQPTPVQKLIGSTRLVMVIQIPVGRSGTLTVNLNAALKQRFRKREVPLPGTDAARPGLVTF
jgi:hypothetical protein